MKRRRPLLALLWALAVLAALPHAWAAPIIETAREASLTVVYTDSDTPLVGARFELYRVADVTPEGQYTLTGGFSRCPIDLDDLSAAAALAAESYAALNGIEPVDSGVTDRRGRLTFSGLTAGLYLVVGSVHTQNGVIYTSAPFFAVLPAPDDNGSWSYDVAVAPKHSAVPDRPDDTVERRVLKLWEDAGAEAQRPDFLVVHLLRNGKVYDTVLLSPENNWSHAWSGLDAAQRWSVAEEVPEGYTVEIERVGVTFVITNRKDAPEPTPTPTPIPTSTPTDSTPTPSVTPPEPPPTAAPDDTPTLPQTGQLWWPVPVLAAAGLALLLIGCIRKRGGPDEE